MPNGLVTVISAGVERGDLLLLRVSCGQDEDGCGEPAPKAAHDVDPVKVGQAEVEDDQLGWVALAAARAWFRRGRWPRVATRAG